MNLAITQLARRDQDAISRHTLNRWGHAQLITYIGGLLHAIDALAADQAAGRWARGLPQRFLRVSYRSHFIFYTIDGATFRVVRILHQRMDAARHVN